MLYGPDCLVLFYESFASSLFLYPPGAGRRPGGLADALGGGNVEVTFQMRSQEEAPGVTGGPPHFGSLLLRYRYHKGAGGIRLGHPECRSLRDLAGGPLYCR